MNNIYCAAPREQYCAAPREQYCAAHREQYCQQSCSVMKTMYSYSIVQLSILLSIMIIITNKLLLSILRSHVPTTVNNCCCFINAEQHCWKNNEQHCLFDNVVQQNCLCKTAYQKKQKTQSVNARKLFYVNLFLACRKYQDTANFFFYNFEFFSYIRLQREWVTCLSFLYRTNPRKEVKSTLFTKIYFV